MSVFFCEGCQQNVDSDFVPVYCDKKICYCEKCWIEKIENEKKLKEVEHY